MPYCFLHHVPVKIVSALVLFVILRGLGHCYIGRSK